MNVESAKDDLNGRRGRGRARCPLAVVVLVRILAIVVGLIGVIRLVEVVRLVGISSSPYYLVVGIVFIIAAVLLWCLHKGGAWLLGVVAFLTIPWVVWQHGVVFWAFFPQLLIPMILAFLAFFLTIPLAKSGRVRWGHVVVGIAAVLIVIVLLWSAFVPHVVA